MKIEKLKNPPICKGYGYLVDALRALKPGQALRLKTAAEFQASQMGRVRVQKERHIKFRQRTEGSDILIFIRP